MSVYRRVFVWGSRRARSRFVHLEQEILSKIAELESLKAEGRANHEGDDVMFAYLD